MFLKEIMKVYAFLFANLFGVCGTVGSLVLSDYFYYSEEHEGLLVSASVNRGDFWVYTVYNFAKNVSGIETRFNCSFYIGQSL